MIEIMGGDLSLTATGLCMPDGSTYTIKTGGAEKGDQRLVILGKTLRHYLRCWPIELMVLELPGRFKSAVAALSIGMAHGVVREALAEHKIPVAYIAPAVLKQFATGKGNADKREMVMACNQARQDWHTIHSNTGTTAQILAPAAITDDNQADAWWLRQMGIWRQFGEAPGLTEIGQTDINGHGLRHRAVFGPWRKDGGAKWPARLRGTAPRR